ncbi:hypothetical protein SDC9_173334 [bioreactor metagenome]|uniref:RND efflux pump membrane fusion protein barrel-sandwich domain-containing protein n=1 Tax=bioreactor metagenome TaxID=1076179 RepID=A0A645GQG5_9ZZZZ
MLKPGMFTKIDVICNRSNERYPCIDNQSLIFDKGKYYVVVVSDRNLFVREVSIKASNASDMYIPIISGLQAGEHIINKNALLIYNSLISN